MSMVLQTPASGKRNATEDDPCLFDQFSAKEEANLVDKEEVILGEKKDATMDEQEKEGDPCVGGGEKEDCDDLWRLLEALAEYDEEEMMLVRVGKEEEGDEDGDEWIERMSCAICLSPDHYANSCPLERGTSCSTIPVVSPDYRVLCQRCGKKKFAVVDSFQTCIKCGYSVLCAVAIRCPCCLEYGHLSKKDPECELYGKELTRENDPLRAVFSS